MSWFGPWFGDTGSSSTPAPTPTPVLVVGSRAGCDESFTPPTAAGRAGLRIARLYDRGRDMKTRAGLRPYAVAIVRARAAGMRSRGDGPVETVGEWQMLPTPKVGDLTSLQEVLDADQLREMGSILLSEISLRYTEDQIALRGWDGKPVPAGEVVFYEIRYLDASGKVTSRARFTTASRPFADTERGQWTVSLVRAPWDRDRGGVLR